MTHRRAETAFTVKEAALSAGVSVDTIRRRLRSGAFPRAVRGQSPIDPWEIPEGDLIAAGLTIGASEVAVDIRGDASFDDAFQNQPANLRDVVIGTIAVLEEMQRGLDRQLAALRSSTGTS